MNHSHSLRQLLRVRQLEEEQSRTSLELALGELNRLERALRAAQKRESRGQALAKAVLYETRGDGGAMKIGFQAASYRISEQSIDRRAALEDSNAARRLIESLDLRLNAVRVRVDQLRREFLEHRVERRQAETLIFEENKRQQSEAELRSQQAVDDWYGGRLIREKHASARKPAPTQIKIS